ncbi:thiamine-phosphate kinase [Vibrio sp. UCD-FRSSP16_10]|uniref:thiamine-phosphate kinase n=1 Tax=unclassified Vibrio TaxID=2614977 RepID=UPI0007FD870F|nr:MULTISPECIES: thiamine-phosphate kinase [unclassified Vibrio]OBT16847.1 thiamine-phosphate kinase [Vibrio sp. UCD-FRSSP16_30]OBT21834.1 thiamine-phosphate kinase [Vibrio sp. UCD-FRSSP16_10]
MAGEFELISKYFANQKVKRDDVELSVGDDCALLSAPHGCFVAVSTDSLVAGTHFLIDADPKWVGHKALASNISDLAAMGAEPAWVSMAISLPKPDEKWLKQFCDGFFPLADAHNLQLIGGDTTRGPLSITLTVHGFIPKGEALLRSGANVGDKIFVSGQLGDSHAGLEVILEQDKRLLAHATTLEERHYCAASRVALGMMLRGKASSCIDISDGLVSDIQHIMNRSKVGAKLNIDKLPVSKELIEYCLDKEIAQQYALKSGEEYELCFTLPQHLVESVQQCATELEIEITEVGEIIEAETLQLLRNNQIIEKDVAGFDHFRC